MLGSVHVPKARYDETQAKQRPDPTGIQLPVGFNVVAVRNRKRQVRSADPRALDPSRRERRERPVSLLHRDAHWSLDQQPAHVLNVTFRITLAAGHHAPNARQRGLLSELLGITLLQNSLQLADLLLRELAGPDVANSNFHGAPRTQDYLNMITI